MLSNLGHVAEHLGHLRQAAAHFAEGLALSEEHRDRRASPTAWRAWPRSRSKPDSPRLARVCWERSTHCWRHWRRVRAGRSGGRDRHTADIRPYLGPAAFETAWDAGRRAPSTRRWRRRPFAAESPRHRTVTDHAQRAATPPERAREGRAAAAGRRVLQSRDCPAPLHQPENRIQPRHEHPLQARSRVAHRRGHLRRPPRPCLGHLPYSVPAPTNEAVARCATRRRDAGCSCSENIGRWPSNGGAEVMQTNGYARPKSLVDTAWVADNIKDDPKVRLIEVDVDTAAYDTGHIPGAVGWDWKKDLERRRCATSRTRRGGRSCWRRSGIDKDTTVVLYGDNNNWFAAFAFWVFKFYGHGNVKLMNGGRKKWIEEGRELTTDMPSYPPTTVPARRSRTRDRAPAATRWLATLGRADRARWWTCARRRSTRASCWRRRTCRRKDRSGADISRARRTSPGRRRSNEDGTFKSADELREIYGGQGVTAGQGDDRLLPHRRAQRPHLVRADAPARLPERAQLRRVVDGVGLADGRADRAVIALIHRPFRTGRPAVAALADHRDVTKDHGICCRRVIDRSRTRLRIRDRAATAGRSYKTQFRYQNAIQ